MTRLERAFELFDTYNKEDIHSIVEQGHAHPAELFYAHPITQMGAGT